MPSKANTAQAGKAARVPAVGETKGTTVSRERRRSPTRDVAAAPARAQPNPLKRTGPHGDAEKRSDQKVATQTPGPAVARPGAAARVSSARDAARVSGAHDAARVSDAARSGGDAPRTASDAPKISAAAKQPASADASSGKMIADDDTSDDDALSMGSSDDDDVVNADEGTSVPGPSSKGGVPRQQSVREDLLAGMSHREAEVKAMGFDDSSESEGEDNVLDLESLGKLFKAQRKQLRSQAKLLKVQDRKIRDLRLLTCNIRDDSPARSASANRKRKDDSSARGASAKRYKGDRPGAQQRKPKPGKTPEERAERDRKFVELARTHHRCFKCGYLVKPEEREAHRSTCSRDKGAFLRRMGMVAAKVARGEDPNAFETR